MLTGTVCKLKYVCQCNVHVSAPDAAAACASNGGFREWSGTSPFASRDFRSILLGGRCEWFVVRKLVQLLDTLSYSLAHLAVPYGGRQDARLEPKYIHLCCSTAAAPAPISEIMRATCCQQQSSRY
jgi:hypothetical protein